ncbi:hypothetical protein BD410DRAFT_730062 [Rickenella mellea]|uniref:Uncharacterized protein n=1 Tax=Rickenella mellea TaxID=50990 RepID=A0A4Y7PS74_9AGAM|nr:hypothetical protein BD410DRAFT_730062 [Rickenella mellea]
MTLEIDVAELVGIVIEGIFYGVFLALFFATVYILTRRRRHSRPNIPMLVGAVVMFLLATAQIVVDTANIFHPFIYLDRTHRIENLSDPTKPLWAAKAAIYFTMMLVGDVIVIYRTFVVWDRNFWVIFVPVCCTIGSAVSVYQTVWALRHIASVTIKEESRWGYAIFALSLAANSIATSLLAYRIWAHEASINSVFAKGSIIYRFNNMFIVKIVLESGLINAAYLLTYTIILRSGSHALELFGSMSTPLVGIIFSTVILRTGVASKREAMLSSSIDHRERSRVTFPVRTPRSGDIEIGIATDSDSIAMDQPHLKAPP